jgi:putative ABC transport system permease protein
MTMLKWLSQVAALIALNVRTLGQRRGSALSTIVGVAGVVAVLVALLSIAEGFRYTMAATGTPDSVLVLGLGSDSEMMSGVAQEEAKIVAEAPGVARTAAGPRASAELFVIVDVPRRSTGTDANVPFRGVQPAAFDVRKDFKIIAGRRFQPGTNEVIVGKAAAEEFAGLDLGSRLHWGQNEWTVVGIFTDGGSLSESEVWTDVKVLQPAYRRGNTFQSVHARLESPGSFDAFKDALTTDPRVQVRVVRESEFYAGQSEALTTMIRWLGGIIAVLMALGAIFGALNTMYNAVAARTREIATLRALGFGRSPVVLSVLAESLLLAVIGAVLGSAVAYLGFNGFRTATLNWQSFSQVAFAFKVTSGLLVMGSILALAIGLIGGLLPAIRAARLPVATALREL